jgi:hypothetical protein
MSNYHGMKCGDIDRTQKVQRHRWADFMRVRRSAVLLNCGDCVCCGEAYPQAAKTLFERKGARWTTCKVEAIAEDGAWYNVCPACVRHVNRDYYKEVRASSQADTDGEELWLWELRYGHVDYNNVTMGW